MASPTRVKQIQGDTSGSILHIGANGHIAEDNSNLFWDISNIRLGVGTNTPTGKIHISDTTNSGIPRLKITGYGTNGSVDNRLIEAIQDLNTVNQNSQLLYLEHTGTAGNNVSEMVRIVGGTAGEAASQILSINTNGSIGFNDAANTSNVAAGSQGVYKFKHPYATNRGQNASFTLMKLDYDMTAAETDLTARTKLGLDIDVAGTYTSSGSTFLAKGLQVTVAGGDNNIAATFEGGPVGIGTTAPQAILHVDGSFRLSNLTTTPAAGYVLQSTDANGNVDWVDPNTLVSGADGNGIFSASNDGGTVPTGFDVALTDTLNFDSNTLVIDGTNNVLGIGTASPNTNYKVDISPAGSFVGALTMTVPSGGTAGGTQRGVDLNMQKTNGIAYGIDSQATGINTGSTGTNGQNWGGLFLAANAVGRNVGLAGMTESFNNPPAGDIAIYGYNGNGTTSSTTAYASYLHNTQDDTTTNYGQYIIVDGTVTTNYGQYIDVSGATTNYGLYVVGANVDSYFEGSVGIGTSSPSALLHVDGSFRLSNLTTTPAAGYVLQSTDALGNADWVASSGLGAQELNDLTDVTTGLPVTPTIADDGKMLFYDDDTGQWITDDTVTHGTVVINAKKSTAGTIAKGTPVYLVGFDADLHTVEVANATSSATMPVIGLAGETLDATNSKHIITFGKVTGIDTTSTGALADGETWAVNDDLYVDTTAGTLTNVRPTGASTQIQRVAKVLRVDASGGQLFVFNTARTAGLPNLTTDNVWIGNANNQPVEIELNDYALTDGFKLEIQTTNAASTELLVGGSGGTRIAVPTNTMYAFEITVTAIMSAAGAGATAAVGDIWVHKYNGAIKNIGGTTSIVGTVTDETIAEDTNTSAWTATVTADNANDALTVDVTGRVDETIEWVAKVKITENSY